MAGGNPTTIGNGCSRRAAGTCKMGAQLRDRRISATQTGRCRRLSALIAGQFFIGDDSGDRLFFELRMAIVPVDRFCGHFDPFTPSRMNGRCHSDSGRSLRPISNRRSRPFSDLADVMENGPGERKRPLRPARVDFGGSGRAARIVEPRLDGARRGLIRQCRLQLRSDPIVGEFAGGETGSLRWRTR